MAASVAKLPQEDGYASLNIWRRLGEPHPERFK